MTKLTFTTQDGEYSITDNRDDLNLNEVMENLVVGVLLAAGYQPISVSEYFPEILSVNKQE